MSSVEQNPSTENRLVVVGSLDPSIPRASLQLYSGRILSVDTNLLLEEITTPPVAAVRLSEATAVVPLIAEELVITKRQVPIETVRLIKTMETTTEQVDVPLLEEHWDITRVPIETEVHERTGMRQEGEVVVYPVFEERLVTRKAIFLIEEVRVQKRVETREKRVEACLQREVLTVERLNH